MVEIMDISSNFVSFMRKIILVTLFFLPCWAWGSGGYDNGTATGKGKFQLDLTWNPFDRFDFGQTYGVMSYGITNKIDVHGYIAHHSDGYQTWYGGLFYQFLNMKRLHVATAIGIRRSFDENWSHLFAPQLLYTAFITESLYTGGSFVNVRNQSSDVNYGTTVDVGVFYRLQFKTERIQSISIGVGGFHPVTWTPNTYFLPTYSIDFKFR